MFIYNASLRILIWNFDFYIRFYPMTDISQMSTAVGRHIYKLFSQIVFSILIFLKLLLRVRFSLLTRTQMPDILTSTVS